MVVDLGIEIPSLRSILSRPPVCRQGKIQLIKISFSLLKRLNRLRYQPSPRVFPFRDIILHVGMKEDYGVRLESLVSLARDGQSLAFCVSA